MERIINMTPHSITLVGADGQVLRSIPSSGEIRCEEFSEFAGAVNLGDGTGFKFFRKKFGKPIVIMANNEKIELSEFLKSFPRETIFVVSRACLESIEAHRQWTKTFFTFCSPADFVRDEQGRVIGCKSFAVI